MLLKTLNTYSNTGTRDILPCIDQVAFKRRVLRFFDHTTYVDFKKKAVWCIGRTVCEVVLVQCQAQVTQARRVVKLRVFNYNFVGIKVNNVAYFRYIFSEIFFYYGINIFSCEMVQSHPSNPIYLSA